MVCKIARAVHRGDPVDVMFENHLPDRTVVEVEVEGKRHLCIGVRQAMKYGSLEAADAGFPLLTSRVRSAAVAYTIDSPKVRDLAERCDVLLLAADRATVLSGARRSPGHHKTSLFFRSGCLDRYPGASAGAGRLRFRHVLRPDRRSRQDARATCW